jgi:Gas vesicle protein
VDVLEENPKIMMPETPRLENKDVSLCKAIDRIPNKGAVLFGEVMISVADIDLVYMGLQVILASMETVRGFTPSLREGQLGPNLLDKGAF